ncbi:membrane-bound metallopeptidase [gamma proteobacterium HTCC5015]|nr:membrane-bound metallopeptidase [gamma proteobacterium HTCC5015]
MADSEREETERKLEEVREEINDLMEDIEDAREDKSDTEQALFKAEQALGNVRKKLASLNGDIDANKSRLNRLETQQSDLQRELASQKQRLANQIRASYISGQREQLKLILNQEDPATLSRIATYYDYLNRARSEHIEEARETLHSLAQVEREIEHENQQLVKLVQQHDRERERLSKHRTSREKALVAVRSQLKQSGRTLSRLRGDEERFEALLKSLSNLLADIPDAPSAQIPFKKLRGNLGWPTQGELSHRYGEPRSPGGLKWQGVLLKAPAGNEVRSVSSGRVAFADYFQGFGLIVIVDHDDGYISLYGHNRLLYVSTGDWIERGDVIAEVGDSGGLERSALYFELRHRGQPIDPAGWLAKR